MKILLIAIFLFTATASAQTPSSTPCLNPDDVKAFRQALADRDFYKQRAENAERGEAAAKASATSWENLYLKEKDRADRVQGGRVDALQGALDTAKDQMADDRQKIGEQNARIIKLESSRKWYFILGSAAGAAAGYYIGQNQDRIINTITPANRPGFRVHF